MVEDVEEKYSQLRGASGNAIQVLTKLHLAVGLVDDGICCGDIIIVYRNYFSPASDLK